MSDNKRLRPYIKTSQLMKWFAFVLVITPLYFIALFLLLETARNSSVIHSSLLLFIKTTFIILYVIILAATYHSTKTAPTQKKTSSTPLQTDSQIKQIDFSNIRRGAPFFTDEIDLLIASMQAMLKNINKQKIELIESHKEMQELAHITLRSQEAERRYVSRELHDQAGQLLVSLRYTVKTLLSDLMDESQQTGVFSTEETLKVRLSTMLTQIDKTLETIRALSHKMRPALLDVGDINLAMQEYCNEFQQGKKLDISYEGADLPYIPEELAISLFRFLQEALTNVLKHANASTVCVHLSKQEGWIKMSVTDNGKGKESGSNQNGIGILGMKERFLLLEGTVEANPNKNGFTITACVPLKEDSQQKK